MKAIIIGLTIVGLLFVSYLAFFHHSEAYHAVIVWDRFSGDMKLEEASGWHLTAPWVAASKIDTRPQRVCVTSSSRSFNCKLVEFIPSAYKEFAATEGFRYYWLSNRISFNFGYDEEYRGVRDILRGYSFSNKKYPFIKIVREYEETN